MIHLPFVAAAGAVKGAMSAPSGQRTQGAVAGAIRGVSHGTISPSTSTSMATRILGAAQGRSAEFHEAKGSTAPTSNSSSTPSLDSWGL